MAIQLLLSEHTSGEYKGHHLLGSPVPYTGPLVNEQWDKHMKRYIISTMDFFELYEHPPASLRINPAIPIPSTFYVSMRTKILHDMLQIPLDDPELDYIEYSKCVNNAISIAAVYWFNSRELNEKENILNTQYPFQSNTFMQQHCPELFANNSLLQSYLDTLFSEGYLHTIQLLSTNILNRSKDPQIQLTCMEALALSAKEMEDYRAAKDNYERAIMLLNINLPDDLEQRAMLHIALAEIFLVLEDDNSARVQFSTARKLSTHLSPDRQSLLLLHVTSAYLRTGMEEEEYATLVELLNLPGDIPKDRKRNAAARVVELNRVLIQGTTPSINRSAKIKQINTQNSVRYFDRGLRHLAAFQCQSARYWLLRSFTLTENPRAHLWTAISAFICGDYDTARNTYSAILEHDESNHGIRVNYGLLLIHANKGQEGIQHIIRCVYEVANNVDDIDEFFSHFVQRYLILSHGVVDLTHFESIAQSLEPALLQVIFYQKVAHHLTDWGYFKRSNALYELALDLVETPERKGNILNNLGVNYLHRMDSSSALRYFKEALNVNPQSHQTHINISSVQATLGDYQSALEHMDKAIEGLPADLADECKKHRSVLEHYARTTINIDSIPNHEIHKPIRLADQSLIKIEDKTNQLDFAFVIGNYAKAVEMMLIDTITESFVMDIRKIKKYVYYEDGRYKVDNQYFWGSHGKPIIPQFLSDLIGFNKSISLGAWARALGNVTDQSSNPIIQRFRNAVLTTIPQEHLLTVRDACRILADERNPKQHRETITKEQALAIREKLIVHINNVIQILYPRS